MTGWPEPYLQPDRDKDCTFYATAYVSRCLGYPEVTAQDVMDWRQRSNFGEAFYPHKAHGAQFRRHWDVHGDSPERKIFWMGPKAQDWARRWLADGWIAEVLVHRKAGMAHAVVLLEAADEGVLLMDPVYGHITEPWGWFLGPGPKAEADEWPGAAPDGRPFYGCHYIEGWYRSPEPESEAA